MTLPKSITKNQRQRLIQLREQVEHGFDRREAALNMGISPSGVETLLRTVFASTQWPRDVAIFDEALALPTVERASVIRRNHELTRFERKPRMDGQELEQRKRATEEARAKREREWLELEQRKYGLTRRARPLSGMPI